MKFSRIEFENFRNFKERGCLEFPTDGAVTVIYGPNGVGKTTLHQLFQWILYGEVHFNKTASTKMYNLQYERDADYGERFSVWGKIDFEHPNKYGAAEYYSVHRTWTYRKELNESRRIEETFRLLKKTGDDWKRIPGDPGAVIEQILPIALSQYFFFDGESMIADLNQKGRESAKSLRKALYSIFDLDVYEHALVHIGTSSSGPSTVLGKLFLSRSANSGSKDVIVARGSLRQTQKRIEDLEDQIAAAKQFGEKCRREIQELSELIGSTPERAALEKRRQQARVQIKGFEDAIGREEKAFGRSVMAQYPNLLLSRVVEEAQFRIGLKIEDETLLPGLTKELILSLLKENTCICGTPLGEEERVVLEEKLRMFPPLSYKYIYDQFKKSAVRWQTSYDPELLARHLEAVFGYRESIANLHAEIRDIDDALRHNANKDDYISRRRAAEARLRQKELEQSRAEQDLGLQKQYLRQRKRKYDELTKASEENRVIDDQIDLMEAVKEHFNTVLTEAAQQYSEQLGERIQELLDVMLTSVRRVSMTPRFELSVRDSFGDEAKSEGQFAVVSFAYIGGIFKLLSDVPSLRGKEFPLILDGPFSKLDVIQRQNVINTIPAYAPQVILFSKDDINQCFAGGIGENIWTIYSNGERNVSHVRRGFDREVFTGNGTDK